MTPIEPSVIGRGGEPLTEDARVTAAPATRERTGDHPPPALARAIRAAETTAISELFDRALAGPRPTTVCPPGVLLSFAQTGNLVLSAGLDGRPVGAVIAFLGFDTAPFARLELLVVDEEHRGRGVARALFAETRRWAAEVGAARLTWTFDPANEADAHLSLHVADAEVHAYLPDQGATIGDARYGGRSGDRLLVGVDPRRAQEDGSNFEAIATLRIPPHDAPPEQQQTFGTRLKGLVERGHPLAVDGVGRYLFGAAPEG